MICKIIGHNIVSRETHRLGEVAKNILICSRCGKTFKMKNKFTEIVQEEIRQGEEYLKEQLETIMEKNKGCNRVVLGAAMEYADINAMNNLRSQIGILKEVKAKYESDIINEHEARLPR